MLVSNLAKFSFVYTNFHIFLFDVTFLPFLTVKNSYC